MVFPNSKNKFILFSVFVSLFLLFSQALFAQKITIIDQTTLQPIPQVLVYNKSKTLHQQSNQKGQLDIQNLLDKDSLILFQHASYQDFSLSFNELKNFDFIVPLTEKTLNINEVIVSASKWEQDRSQISNEVIQINPKEIAFKNPQTSADMLTQTGQVFVQKSQLGGGSPMLRGFAASSVLIVMDGLRVNNAIFRSGNVQNIILIDPNALENTELVFGAGSVIYGSDALGGVMDFHTLTPRFAFENNVEFSGKSLLRYSSANNEKTFHTDFTISGKKWSSLTSFSFSDFEDLRAGANHPKDHPDFGKRFEYVDRINGQDSILTNSNVHIQKNSAYNQTNFMQKIRFRPNRKLDFLYSFYYTNSSNIPRYDRLIQKRDGKLRYAEWFYSPQKWYANRLSVNYLANKKLVDIAKITLSQQRIDEDRNDRSLNSDWLRTRREDVNVYTLNLDLDKSVNDKSEFYYGLAITHNDVKSSGESKNILTQETEKVVSRYPDGGSQMSTFAAYFSNKYKFNDKLSMTSGLRYSHILLDAKFVDTTFYQFPFEKLELNTGAVNGTVGMAFLPSPTWQWNVNLATGFRAPNVDDVGKIFDSEPGNVIVPNAELAPEYTYNAELGFIKYIADKAKIAATIYYTHLDNAIVRRDFSFNGQDSIVYDGDLSRVQALVNAGKAYVWGYNIQFHLNLTKKLIWKNSFTFTGGEDLIDNIPLRHIPPVFGQSSLDFKTKKLQASFNINFNAAKPFDELSPSEQNKTHLYTENGTPAWFTLNCRAAYQFNKNINFNVALENILDRHYRPFSSGISAAGRNFVVSLRGNF
jgi:hemoglobin/transferrin/lactoferrin receptor protein